MKTYRQLTTETLQEGDGWATKEPDYQNWDEIPTHMIGGSPNDFSWVKFRRPVVEQEKLQPISDKVAEEIIVEAMKLVSDIPRYDSRWEWLKGFILKRLSEPEVTQCFKDEMVRLDDEVDSLKYGLEHKDLVIENLKKELNSKSQWPQPRCLRDDPPEEGSDVIIWSDTAKLWFCTDNFEKKDLNLAETHWLPAPPIPTAYRPFPETPEQVQAVIDQMKAEGKSLGIPREEAAKMAKQIAKGAPIPSVKEEEKEEVETYQDKVGRLRRNFITGSMERRLIGDIIELLEDIAPVPKTATRLERLEKR